MPSKESVLRYAKLTEHAVAPFKGSEFAAGFDLSSAYEYTIEPLIEVPVFVEGKVTMSWHLVGSPPSNFVSLIKDFFARMFIMQPA
ncbi:unnamed protein product [Soboliphyme baturini]|uniref:Peptidase A1 domain-containing protein n=1 Tax=Soboliphyme baturini TaxID=241478 RepID=A0A183I986_9BILA|nr:unnamed protein product [Soboliphyme baturini]